MKKTYITYLLCLFPGLAAQAQLSNLVLGFGAGSNITVAVASSTLMGYEAGTALYKGTNNFFAGYNAGRNWGESMHNTFIGAYAGAFPASMALYTADENTFIGIQAGMINYAGQKNTFVGDEAGKSNTVGSYNTFIGESAGQYNDSGQRNAAVGYQSLGQNMRGSMNAALGPLSGYRLGGSDESNARNVLIGNSAGYDLRTSFGNTMVGDNAGPNTENGHLNTFVGALAGWENNRTQTGGHRNNSLGVMAGHSNRSGEDNLWLGLCADSAYWYSSFSQATLNDDLQTASVSQPNVSINPQNKQTDIYRTTSVGNFSSVEANDGVSLGFRARTRGSKAIAVGSTSDASGANAIALGADAVASHAESLAIGQGATSHGDNIAVIGGTAVQGWHPSADEQVSLGATNYRFSALHGQAVAVRAGAASDAVVSLAANNGTAASDRWTLSAGTNGAFTVVSDASGTNVPALSVAMDGNLTVAGDVNVLSDRRYKKDIETIDGALEMVSRLDGKTYAWKDPARGERRHVGLIAQEVQAVVPELVSEVNADGTLSVNLQGLVPVLINAVNELSMQNRQQAKELEALRAELRSITPAAAVR